MANIQNTFLDRPEFIKHKKTNTDDLIRLMQFWHPTHDELRNVLSVFASSVKHRSMGLSIECIASVLDYCDEACGQIENDNIEKQAQNEAMDKSFYDLRKDFEAMAQLDVLTIRDNK